MGFWRAITKILPKNKLRFKSEVAELMMDEKKLKTNEGLEIKCVLLICFLLFVTLQPALVGMEP